MSDNLLFVCFKKLYEEIRTGHNVFRSNSGYMEPLGNNVMQ